MRCLSHRRITPPGSDLLLQPANFRQQSDKQAYLLKLQRRFAVVFWVKMRYALSQFIQRLLNWLRMPGLVSFSRWAPSVEI